MKRKTRRMPIFNAYYDWKNDCWGFKILEWVTK